MHLKEEAQSIRYQTNNIEENIMDVGPPPKPWLILHELILWIPLFGIMKFIHACLKKKIKKTKKNVERPKKCTPEWNMAAKVF